MAATGLDYHVALPAQDDIIVSIIVEQRNGTQLSRHTAHLGDDIWLHQMYQGLHSGVVGGVHTGVQWVDALPSTVIGGVALGGNDRVQPAKVTEADIELMPAANFSAVRTVAIIKDS